MAEIVRETKKFIWITLLDTKTICISLVIDKEDRACDRIRFVQKGTQTGEPETIVVFRYEDEQLIESMMETYVYKG